MKRNKYNLSYYKMFTTQMGLLTPIGLTEVLPGDTFRLSTSALVRLGAMLAPVMHPVHVKIHHWFVPHRLVWEDWEDFITGGPDGMDASVFPTIPITSPIDNATGGLADHYGINVGFVGDISALPFRGYTAIYNEWYRDQDLISEQPFSMASGTDNTTGKNLLRVAWAKDYLTTARPWTQKGPDVTIPMATTAPVERITGAAAAALIRRTTTDAIYNSTGLGSAADGGLINEANSDYLYLDPNGTMQADLGDAPGGINELRLAFALQRYEEARARYGSRYTEYLKYLGVNSSDARLQRPEYLGGGKNTIQFSEVLQTAEGTDPVGELRGHGIGSTRSNRFLKFFEEHGYIHSFMTVTPIPVYSDGMDRTWLRRTKEDFFQKELQYIGQQDVRLAEVRATDNTSQTTVFGYQDRYAEYRQGFHKISGEFRNTLNYWNMARQFASNPSLNAAFVTCEPTDRIFADTNTSNVYVMARHSIQARRIVGQGGKSFVF